MRRASSFVTTFFENDRLGAAVVRGLYRAITKSPQADMLFDRNPQVSTMVMMGYFAAFDAAINAIAMKRQHPAAATRNYQMQIAREISSNRDLGSSELDLLVGHFYAPFVAAKAADGVEVLAKGEFVPTSALRDNSAIWTELMGIIQATAICILEPSKR